MRLPGVKSFCVPAKIAEALQGVTVAIDGKEYLAEGSVPARTPIGEGYCFVALMPLKPR